MMRHRIRLMILISVVALLGALLPAMALAQDTGSSDDGLLLRVNGPVEVSSQDVVDNVIVIGSGALIAFGWRAWQGPGESPLARGTAVGEPEPVH